MPLQSSPTVKPAKSFFVKDQRSFHRQTIVPARLAVLLFFVALLSPFLIVNPFGTGLQQNIFAVQRPFQPPSLTVVTLIYGQSSQHLNIEHNCAVISATRHRFVIFTDDMSKPYCGVCDCRHFEQRQCVCPEGPTGCTDKNPCEKLFFIVEALNTFKEMVLLDNDLMVLKDFFLDRLAFRAVAHDFLATYGHMSMVTGYNYYKDFNSGLLFMRWMPNVNYEDMKRTMYKKKSTRDQNIISEFVQKNYPNWDTLSWKWHCRSLERYKVDIPASECYTLHDKNESERILVSLNMTRMTVV